MAESHGTGWAILASHSTSLIPPPDRLVGRSVEFEMLARMLGEVRAGAPRVAVIEGPAGIGKTSLIRRFVADAGLRVLAARCDEWESQVSYGVVCQLAAGFEDAGPLGGLRAATAVAAPFAVGALLVEALGQLQESGPVALVVDDAHWADLVSLQALTFALRRLRADQVMACFTARNDRPGLPESLRRLGTSEGGVHLELAGLNVAAVVELAASRGVELSARAAKRVLEHTGGNPLYATALLDELDQSVPGDPAVLLPAPRLFAMGIVRRMALCGPATEELVAAAAVIGQRCPLALAAKVAGLADPGSALDEAVEAGLLEMAGERQVRFHHPLIRSAIYHHLSPGHRSELHLAVAARLEGINAVAHRIAAALIEDPVLADEVEALATAESSRGAWGSAAALMLSAGRLSPDIASRQRRVLEAMVAWLAVGDAARASELAAEVAGFAESALKCFVLGHLAFLTGRQPEAEDLLLEAWRRCDPATDNEVARLASNYLAQMYTIQVRCDEAVLWAQRSPGPTADPRLPASAFGIEAIALLVEGRAEEAFAVLASIPDGRADMTADEAARVLPRGQLRLWCDDLVGAFDDLSAVVASCKPALAGRDGIIALMYLSEVEYRMGRWDDSVRHADLAVSLAADSEQAWFDAGVHSLAVFALASRGDWNGAQAHVEIARTAAVGLGDSASVSYTAVAGAHLAFCRSEPAAIVEALRPLLELPRNAAEHEPGVHPWRQLYIEASVCLGRLDDAASVLEAFEDLAAARGRRSAVAAAARERGILEAVRGDHARAFAAFEHALDCGQALGMPFEEALTQLAYGRCLRRSGERRAAAAELIRATNTFNALGARPFASRAEDELAACGRPRRSVGADGGLDLSPQQLAVARLVGLGLTNKAVAAELVVSAKTVDYHLGQIYTRLGLHSRSQLAALLASL